MAFTERSEGPVTAGLRRTSMAAAVAAGLGGLYLIDPNKTHVPLCPLHAATGLLCPFCGITRATFALLHGDFGTAVHDNALFVLASPLLIVLGIRWFASGANPLAKPLPRLGYCTVIGILLIFAVVRNMPAGHWFAPAS